MSSDPAKMAARRGLLIILSSPSGAGKSTLTRQLLGWDETLSFSVSATTRPPREGEVDGKDYYFLEESLFRSQVTAGEMLEHAHVFGNFYGSPKAPVETAINEGRDVLFDIDWQGAQQIQNSDLGKHTLSIFILPPSIDELRRRLVGRGQDSKAVIGKRMQKSWDEISHWAEYDYVIINDNLDRAAAQVKAILNSERLKRERQVDISRFVKDLCNKI